MFNLPMNVSTRLKVDKPAGEIFELVGDFNTWKHWSPWLSQEPSCPVTIQGAPDQEGHTQSWDGELIGSGNMILSRLKSRESLEYRLNFLKPWKSTSQVTFYFTPMSETETCVRWVMHGSIPIYLFFLRKLMISLIMSDYDRGLMMLKEYLEKGQVNSEVKLTKTPVEQKGFYWVGIRQSCSIAEMPGQMDEDFKKIFEVKEKNSQYADPKFFFSLYHNYDIVGKKVSYTAAMAFSNKVEAVSALRAGHVPAHLALISEHQGAYRFLGNAWSAAIALQRSYGKADKRVPMYEIYVNHPGEVEERELVTRIMVPVR